MGQVGHALLTRSPLSPPSKARWIPFDLHVLSTPPAFILSQDQTLMLKVFLDQNYTSNFVSEIFLFLKVFIP